MARIFDIIEIGIQGPAGSGGPGPVGMSAYQVAVQNGFIGSEQDWLNSLAGNGGVDVNNLPDFSLIFDNHLI